MLKRPGGYGETDLLELNPLYHQYKSKKPYFIAALFAVPLLIIGLMPLFFQWAWFVQTFNLAPDYNLGVLGGNFEGAVMFDYKNADLSSGSSIMTLAELNSAKNIAEAVCNLLEDKKELFLYRANVIRKAKKRVT